MRERVRVCMYIHVCMQKMSGQRVGVGSGRVSDHFRRIIWVSVSGQVRVQVIRV